MLKVGQSKRKWVESEVIRSGEVIVVGFVTEF
jgi:hypothetical protein